MTNVRIVDSNRGIGIRQRSGERNGGETAGTGRIRDIVIKNIESTTRFDRSKPEFWGSGEPFVITVLPRNGNCCSGVQNITLVNVSAVAENSALISSLGSAAGDRNPPRVRGIRLENVGITIKNIGSTSRPQRDYRPGTDRAGTGPGTMPPGVVPALVNGLVVENIEDITLVDIRVAFCAHERGRQAATLGVCLPQHLWRISCASQRAVDLREHNSCGASGLASCLPQRSSLKLPMLIVTGEGLCSILTHLGCP
jgi:hypothetical protein